MELDVVAVGEGVWRDRSGRRYLTNEAVEEQTGLPRSTVRAHARTETGHAMFQSIDRGPGRKPRWLVPESDVIAYIRTNVKPPDALAPVSLDTMVHELISDKADLRSDLARALAEVADLQSVVDSLQGALSDANAAFARMRDIARRRGAVHD